MTGADSALALVHDGDFAVAFSDRERLRDVCLELMRYVDPALGDLAAELAELIAADRASGTERWAALASAVRGVRGATGRSSEGWG